MSERALFFLKFLAVAAAVILAVVLTVIGGNTEGWTGIAIILFGQTVLIFLLYLYNRKYR